MTVCREQMALAFGFWSRTSSDSGSCRTKRTRKKGKHIRNLFTLTFMNPVKTHTSWTFQFKGKAVAFGGVFFKIEHHDPACLTCAPRRALTQASDASQMAVRS